MAEKRESAVPPAQRFEGTDLGGAVFSRVSLAKARFSESKLDGARIEACAASQLRIKNSR